MFEPKSMKSQPITAHENFQYLSCAIIESFDHDLQLGTGPYYLSCNTAEHCSTPSKAHTEREIFYSHISSEYVYYSSHCKKGLSARECRMGTLLYTRRMRKGVTRRSSLALSALPLKIGFWILFKYGWLGAHQDKRVKNVLQELGECGWTLHAAAAAAMMFYQRTKRKRVDAARVYAGNCEKRAYHYVQPESNYIHTPRINVSNSICYWQNNSSWSDQVAVEYDGERELYMQRWCRNIKKRRRWRPSFARRWITHNILLLLRRQQWVILLYCVLMMASLVTFFHPRREAWRKI